MHKFSHDSGVVLAAPAVDNPLIMRTLIKLNRPIEELFEKMEDDGVVPVDDFERALIDAKIVPGYLSWADLGIILERDYLDFSVPVHPVKYEYDMEGFIFSIVAIALRLPWDEKVLTELLAPVLSAHDSDETRTNTLQALKVCIFLKWLSIYLSEVPPPPANEAELLERLAPDAQSCVLKKRVREERRLKPGPLIKNPLIPVDKTVMDRVETTRGELKVYEARAKEREALLTRLEKEAGDRLRERHNPHGGGPGIRPRDLSHEQRQLLFKLSDFLTRNGVVVAPSLVQAASMPLQAPSDYRYEAIEVGEPGGETLPAVTLPKLNNALLKIYLVLKYAAKKFPKGVLPPTLTEIWTAVFERIKSRDLVSDGKVKIPRIVRRDVAHKFKELFETEPTVDVIRTASIL